jgi:TolB-like protein/Tfp pilus assembly protein PilF
VDHRADIFSLGVMLYEMLAGRRPFEGATTSDVMAAILTKEPEPLEELTSEAGPKIAQAVIGCLAKEREERIQTMGELAAQLQAATGLSEQSAPRAARSRSRPLWIAATLLLLMIAVAVYLKFAPTGAPDPQIRSLVVLPLENLSGDPAQEYFADGMTDALIGDLAKIGALRVISRTSAMRYKGTKKSLREIAHELQVDGVVEGSVQRSGPRVRIRVQLIHADAERHLWVETYERDLRDVLALQSEVARAIAHEIQIKITPDEQARLSSAQPVNRKAYNNYLLGIFYWNRRTEENTLKAIDYFQSAVLEDKTYAPAYAGLADCYIVLAGNSFQDPRNCFPRAKDYATKALAIDGNLAEAHIALANVKAHYELDRAGAEQEHKRAIELNPGNSTAHMRYAWFLAQEGRTEASLAESRRALELDPVSLMVNTGLGQRLYNARRFDEAIEQLRKTLLLDPNFYMARLDLGQVYAQIGLYAESIAELNKAVELSRDNSALPALGYVYAISGRKSEARQALAELQKLSQRRYVSSFGVAAIYTGLGEKNQAFTWLEKAFVEREARLAFLKVEPKFDSLQSDPRWKNLLRRMNFPEERSDK